MSIRYTQPCPTCGRRIQVQASLMGHSVACPHCSAEFVAAAHGEGAEYHSRRTPPDSSAIVDPLMARVERALARASAQQSAV